MRYMMLIYSRESEAATAEEMEQIAAGHRTLMEDAARRGIFRAADPLEPATTATTVRMQNGKVLLTDGPFAETKEQLAGYYILDCEDLDEALEWAARIPTACQGKPGCVEVRPIREIRGPSAANG
ncbi:MAG TPA: YciI family protein [Bryobacteraceae bacterium]|nr:YciI family protein [Bryobacteraceae bacterium]